VGARVEQVQQAIGHHFGTDFVREEDGGLYELLDAQLREHLEGLGVTELIQFAGDALMRQHRNNILLVNPLKEVGPLEHGDIVAVDKLFEAVAVALSKKLVGDLPPGIDDEQREEIYQQIGSCVVGGYHAVLILHMEQELKCWRSGDWDALLNADWITEEEFLDLMDEFPDGNPIF
jgi:hypothetical protein